MLRFLRAYPHLYHRLRRIQFILARPNLPAKIGSNCTIHPTAMFVGEMTGVELGDNVRIDAYAQIINRTGSTVVIGNDTYIGPFAVVKNSSKFTRIKIGANCSLQHYSIIYGAGPVEIGDFVRIASHCAFVPVNKGFADLDTPIAKQGGTQIGITLGDDIWVGSGVRILDGCRIGKGSILAAGAVVKESYGPYSIIGGIPSRLLKRRDEQAALADREIEATGVEASLDAER